MSNNQNYVSGIKNQLVDAEQRQSEAVKILLEMAGGKGEFIKALRSRGGGWVPERILSDEMFELTQDQMAELIKAPRADIYEDMRYNAATVALFYRAASIFVRYNYGWLKEQQGENVTDKTAQMLADHINGAADKINAINELGAKTFGKAGIDPQSTDEAIDYAKFVNNSIATLKAELLPENAKVAGLAKADGVGGKRSGKLSSILLGAGAVVLAAAIATGATSAAKNAEFNGKINEYEGQLDKLSRKNNSLYGQNMIERNARIIAEGEARSLQAKLDEIGGLQGKIDEIANKYGVDNTLEAIVAYLEGKATPTSDAEWESIKDSVAKFVAKYGGKNFKEAWDNVEKLIREQKGDIDRLENTLEDVDLYYQGIISGIEAERDAAIAERDAQKARADAAETKVTELEKKLAAGDTVSKADYDAAIAERDAQKARADAAEQKVSELEGVISGLRQEISAKDIKIAELEGLVESYKNEEEERANYGVVVNDEPSNKPEDVVNVSDTDKEQGDNYGGGAPNPTTPGSSGGSKASSEDQEPGI